MSDKSLKDVAIELEEGKLYTPVHERIKFFNDTYENGGIETQILSLVDGDRKIIKALVTPDWLNNPQRRFTGHSEAFYDSDDKYMSAALEVAETSAIGRALGAMGIGLISSMASVNEIVKNEASHKTKKPKKIDLPNYDSIPVEEQREEALLISKSINASESVDALKTLIDPIKKSGLAKQVIDLLKLDYNNKMKELKNA